MPYTKTAWVDNTAPAINAANLNKLENAANSAYTTYNVADTAYGATVYATVALAAAGTDATTAVNNAITAASNAGGGVVLVPGWVRISGQVVLKSNVTLSGIDRNISGLVFDQTVSSTGVVATGVVNTTKNPTAQISVGSRTMTVTSSGYSAGQWLAISDTSATSWGGLVTRVGLVTAGTPDTITLEERNPVLFTTAASIQQMTPVTNIGLRDLALTNATGNCTDNTLRKNGWVNFQYCVGVTVDNVAILGGAADSLNFAFGGQLCRNVRVSNCSFEKCGDSDPTPTQNTRDCEFRHSSSVLIANNIFQRSGGSSAMSYTGVSWLTIIGNIVGGYTDWVSQTTSATAISSDNGGRGIKLIYGCVNFTVTGNSVHNSGFDGIHVVGCQHGSISGNAVFAAHDVPINIQNDGTGPVCHHVNCVGNTVNYHQAVSSGAQGIFYGTVTNSTIVGNTVANLNGGPGILLDATCTDIVVSGNQIDTVGSFGIQINTGGTRILITDNIVRGATSNAINTQNSAGNNYVYCNIVNSTSIAIKTTATADSVDLPGVANTTTPGKNAVI